MSSATPAAPDACRRDFDDELMARIIAAYLLEGALL